MDNFQSLQPVLTLTSVFLPLLVIAFVAFKYFRTYSQIKESKAWEDPQSLWNGLRGTTTALVEMVVLIAISEFVFLLASQKIISGEAAATFFGGVVGFLIGSARARAPKPIPGK
jgi:hypothetical protein